MAEQTNQLQKELVESGLLEPISINGADGYRSTSGESKNVVSVNGKPVGVSCGDKLYGFNTNIPSGLCAYVE
ncbi:MAG: hypothetical protein KAJ24_07470 [Candidatus Aenigmarchaeota archaeon]|nr:hypothetical protein [Candidatus Aenigmarchaeota archaeon]